MDAPVVVAARHRPLHPVVEQLVFVLVFAGAGVLGRLTIVDGITVGLVWPAIGVAVVWCSVSARRGPGWVLVTLNLILLTALGVSRVTDVALAPTVASMVANLVSLAVVVRGLRTPALAMPDLFAPSAASTLSTVRGVLALTTLTAIGCGLGAAVGAVAFAGLVPSAQVTAFTVVLWWGRNVVGIVAVVALVVFVSAALRSRRSTAADDPSVLDGLDAALARSRGTAADLPVLQAGRVAQHRVVVGLLFVATAVAYTLDLSHVAGPTAYPLLAFTIWSGLLCSSLVTVLHTAMSATLVVVAAMHDRGPFSLVQSPMAMAAEVQLYVAFILLLGLLLSAARSEIRSGLTRVLAAESHAAARADLLVAVAEAMNDGLLVIEPDGRIVAGNRAAAELLRVDREEVDHRDQIVMRRPDGTSIGSEAHPAVLALRDGLAPAQDVLVFGPDGSPRTLSVRATRLDDPGRGSARRTPESSVAMVFTDVTDDRAQHDYLAGFAGMVAHDLRSPLSTVRGWLDMASLIAETEPTASARSLTNPLERATAGAVQMGRLIDDLLSHVSAHGQVLELEEVDLARLAREVADAHGVGESLELGACPPVWADRALVHQLLTNLVGNAAKYRHPDRALAVSLRGVELHGVVTFVLEDNGAGIPEPDREKVFQRFFRVEEHRDLAAGTGLGLAMCRTIVERHGGTIVALPRLGRVGTAIEVTLAAVPPLDPEPEQPSTHVAAPVRHLRSVAD